MAKTKQPSLTLHHLIVDLSFWGTSVRLLLFALLASVAFAFSLSEATSDVEIDKQIILLIYALGSFLLFDFGYVLVARAYSLVKWFDVLALCLVDVLIALIYIAPKVVVSSVHAITIDPMVYIFFIAIGGIAIRMLLGLLYGASTVTTKKQR